MFDVTADGDTINVGARVFEGDFPLDLWAWMDDSQTDIQDGYIEDNDMLFRILDKSERIEYFVSAEYLQVMVTDCILKYQIFKQSQRLCSHFQTKHHLHSTLKRAESQTGRYR